MSYRNVPILQRWPSRCAIFVLAALKIEKNSHNEANLEQMRPNICNDLKIASLNPKHTSSQTKKRILKQG